MQAVRTKRVLIALLCVLLLLFVAFHAGASSHLWATVVSLLLCFAPPIALFSYSQSSAKSQLLSFLSLAGSRAPPIF
jgi:hypothetical protein